MLRTLMMKANSVMYASTVYWRHLCLKQQKQHAVIDLCQYLSRWTEQDTEKFLSNDVLFWLGQRNTNRKCLIFLLSCDQLLCLNHFVAMSDWRSVAEWFRLGEQTLLLIDRFEFGHILEYVQHELRIHLNVLEHRVDATVLSDHVFVLLCWLTESGNELKRMKIGQQSETPICWTIQRCLLRDRISDESGLIWRGQWTLWLDSK